MIIIPGFQKTGSTTLYEILGMSPDIFAPPELKDFHLWSNPGSNSKWINKYLESNSRYGCHCAVNYILNKEYIHNILKNFPDAIFIIVVRDPINRTKSSFDYFKKMGLEFGELNEAILRELENNDEIVKPIQESYLEPGLYWKHINTNLLPFVDRRNVQCFLFEDIFSDGNVNIDVILDGLKIEKFKYPKTLKRNAKGTAKYPVINKLFFKQNELKSRVARLLPLKIRTSFKSWIYKKNVTNIDFINDKFSKETLEKLKLYFQEDVDYLKDEFDLNIDERWENFK